MSASPPSKPNNILCIPSEFLDDIAPAVPGSSFNLCFNVFIADHKTNKNMESKNKMVNVHACKEGAAF